MTSTNHPLIVIEKQIRGNHPIIRGTGMRVLDIAIEYEYKGYSIDQILDYHPHLTLSQIHAALSYYYENQHQFDKQIKAEQALVNKLKNQLSGHQLKQLPDLA